jgi:multicomponent Na+:H+ antiporter subunit A
MPLLAAASPLAAASLVSLPLTVGFFADEFFFAATLERGVLFAVLAAISAGMTLAYTWRFLGVFLGDPGAEAHRVPRSLVAPVVVLAVVGLLGAFVAGPFERLAEAAGEVSLGASTPLDASYHPEILPEYVMALAAYAVGVGLILSRSVWSPAALGISRLGKVAGPERLFGMAIRGLNRLSDAVHRVEIQNLRGRVASVLVPTAVMVGAGLLATGLGSYDLGPLRLREAPVMLALLAVAAASIAATLTRRHVTLALVLSSVGFMLAVVYAFYGAPNVALVAVLIETVQTLLLVATLRLLPYRVLRHQAELPLKRRNRKVLVAAASGAFGFVVVWGALSQPPAGQSVAEELTRLTPEAHAKNVVTATLADFRGLDTLGEITVVALVLLGVATLLGGLAPERNGGPDGGRSAAIPAARVVVRGIARLLYLPTFLVAAALLVKGFVETGDGFSAGVVAALGVLLRYLAFGYERTKVLPAVRHSLAVAFCGLLLALGVAAAPLLFGEAPLTHYPPAGTEPIHVGTIELMTAVLFDVGVFVLVFGFTVGVVSIFARAGEAVGQDGYPDGRGAERS